jgi:hypothetical protein
MQDWLAMVRDAADEGRRFARVRVVSLPLSDYNRWSYVIAQHNIAAGEDIRYLERGEAEAVGLPGHDYWLFDSRQLLQMRSMRMTALLAARSLTILSRLCGITTGGTLRGITL